MRENVKLSKIDKKGNKQLKLNTCINVVNVLYLLEHNVCLKVKVNKIDGRQTRNTTEWLFLNFYYGKCELVSLILYVGHNHDKRLYYFNHILSII